MGCGPWADAPTRLPGVADALRAGGDGGAHEGEREGRAAGGFGGEGGGVGEGGGDGVLLVRAVDGENEVFAGARALLGVEAADGDVELL